MKTCRKCGEEKPLTEFHRHGRTKDGLYYYCKPCSRLRAKEYRQANKEKVRAKDREYKERNREKLKAKDREYGLRNRKRITERVKQWRAANRERDLAQRRLWYERNREKLREKARRYRAQRTEYHRRWYEDNRDYMCAKAREWRRSNPEKVREYSMRRIASGRRATPPWLTTEHFSEMQDKYNLALKLTRNIGVQYHVDHIWPLRGEDAWGLHVPWNLQVITAENNVRKSNKRPDRMLQELTQ